MLAVKVFMASDERDKKNVALSVPNRARPSAPRRCNPSERHRGIHGCRLSAWEGKEKFWRHSNVRAGMVMRCCGGCTATSRDACVTGDGTLGPVARGRPHGHNARAAAPLRAHDSHADPQRTEQKCPGFRLAGAPLEKPPHPALPHAGNELRSLRLLWR